MEEGGEVALILEYDNREKCLSLRGYAIPPDKQFSEKGKRNAYLDEAVKCSDVPDEAREQMTKYLTGFYRQKGDNLDDVPVVSTFASKYKPVALKVKPIYAELPEQYRIIRDIKGDPLKNMPRLNPRPPDFVPMGRYTQERKDEFDKIHKGDFLWPEERKLMYT